MSGKVLLTVGLSLGKNRAGIRSLSHCVLTQCQGRLSPHFSANGGRENAGREKIYVSRRADS